MATDTRNQQRKTSGKRQQRSVKVQDYVAEKLNVTQRQVRQVDIMSYLITLVSIVLGFLLSVAIIDAWIFPLGTLGRWAGFITLVFGTLAFIALTVGRSMLRKVNPDYAAQMIEESQPEFKNSLLNYVSLTRKPQGTKAAVMDAVSRQAATDISTVPVETMVDRSAMIRVSLILAGVIFCAALYTLLSPKSPFQSVARVVFPNAKLAPPSVVTIEDVKPGDAEAFFGDDVEVSAKVLGRHNPEDVKLFYSTKDGQVVDREIPMAVRSGTTDTYTASLSMDGSGIQQSLEYHIVARDGATPKFSIDVRTNPSIAIEQVSLQPPQYSKLEPWTQPQGNIEALEGTRVTVKAKANLPIKSAEIELLSMTNKGDFVTARKVVMNTEPNNLQQTVGRFTVAMNKRRTRPAATHYRLNFVSQEGHKNEQPNSFPIKVIPDLAPEIKVLNPLERASTVPINGQATIRVQANDPDFEISKIELEIQHNDQRIFGQSLPLQPVQDMKLVNGDFLLDVSQQFPLLNVGDQLVFHATASDNRKLPGGRNDANQTQSEKYVIEIAEPQDQKQQRQNQKQQNKKQRKSEDQPQDKKQNPQDMDQQKRPEDQPKDERGDKDQTQPNENGSDPQPEGDPQDRGDQEPQDQDAGDGDQNQPDDQGQQAEGDAGEEGESGKQSDGSQQTDQGTDEQESTEGDSQPGDNGQQRSGGKQDWQQQPEGATEQNPDGRQGNQDSAQGNEQSGPENDAERMAKLSEMLGDSEEQDPANPDQDGTGSDQNQQESGGDRKQPDDGQSGDGQQQNDQGNQDNGKAQDRENQQAGSGEGDQQQRQNQPGQQQQENSQKGPQGQQPEAGETGEAGEKSKAGETGETQPGNSGQEKGNDPATEQGNKQPGEQNQPGEKQQQQEDQQNGQGQRSEAKQQQGNGEKNKGQQEQGDGEKSKQQGEGTGEPQGNQPKQGDSSQQQQENPNSSQGEENGDAQGSGGSKPGAESPNGTPSEESPDGKPSGDKGKQGTGEASKGNGSKPGQGGKKPGEGQGEGEGKGQGQGQGEGQGQGKGEGQGEGQGKGEGQGSGKGGKGDSKGQGPGSSEGGGGSQQGSNEKAGSQPATGSRGTGQEEQISEEEANLQFAEKTTDMILQRLKKQRNNPDQKLLDELNWTKDDMNRFIDRWEKMRKDAATGNEADRKRFQKQLSGLGLRPPGARTKSTLKGDKKENYFEDSSVDLIPPELRDEFRAFQRDQNRSDR